MFDPVTLMFGISALSVVLGFVALLKQKTYLDPTTKQPLEVELPLFGKLKTNVPALAFVFLGIASAVLVFEKAYGQTDDWQITGWLRAPGGAAAPQWEEGTLALFPSGQDVEISSQGRFVVNIEIPRGRTFEDAVKSVDYTHRLGSTQFYPEDEYGRFVRGDTASLITRIGDRVREFKPLVITAY